MKHIPVSNNLNISSPITGGNDIKLLQVFKSDKIKQRWESELGIKIDQEFIGTEKFFLYECTISSLQFFYPPSVVGSSSLYEKLSSFDWYYMDDKWEFDEAEKDIVDLNKVADIGCATGIFLEKLGRKGFSVMGFECNRKAAQVANSKGIQVITDALEEVADDFSEYFDAVCSFQVLEHVSNPLNYLKLCLSMLKPGGRLILSVPNGEVSDTTLTDALLDMPPHHISRWYKHTFEELENYLKVKIDHISEEKLAKYHIRWYLDSIRKKITKKFWIRSAYIFTFENVLRLFLYMGGRKIIRGHTLYVCYEKI